MGCCLSCILPPRERAHISHPSPSATRPQRRTNFPPPTASPSIPRANRPVRVSRAPRYTSEEHHGAVSESSPLLPRTATRPALAPTRPPSRTRSASTVDRQPGAQPARFTPRILRDANHVLERYRDYAKMNLEARGDWGYLRKHWATILEGLKFTRPTNETGTLTLEILERACRCDDADYFLIELLRGMEQLDPYDRTQAIRYGCLLPFRNGSAINDPPGVVIPYEPTSRNGKFGIPYNIRTVYNAMHFMLHCLLPKNASLGEYLYIFQIVARLIFRCSGCYRIHQREIPKTISLLVVMASPYDPDNYSARATIGFSATAFSKEDTLEDRFQNLPALKELETWPSRSPTPLGGGAEDETLAHLDSFIKLVRKQRSILAITSTISLVDWTPFSNCGQCTALLHKLREDYHARHIPLKTLDLKFE